MLGLVVLSGLAGGAWGCAFGSSWACTAQTPPPRQPDPVYRDRYIYDRSHHEGYMGHSHHHDYDFDPNMVRDQWRLENRERYPLPQRQPEPVRDFRSNNRDVSDSRIPPPRSTPEEPMGPPLRSGPTETDPFQPAEVQPVRAVEPEVFDESQLPVDEIPDDYYLPEDDFLPDDFDESTLPIDDDYLPNLPDDTIDPFLPTEVARPVLPTIDVSQGVAAPFAESSSGLRIIEDASAVANPFGTSGAAESAAATAARADPFSVAKRSLDPSLVRSLASGRSLVLRPAEHNSPFAQCVGDAPADPGRHGYNLRAEGAGQGFRGYASLEACCHLCFQFPKCRAVNVDQELGLCFLKRLVPGPSPKQGQPNTRWLSAVMRN